MKRARAVFSLSIALAVACFAVQGRSARGAGPSCGDVNGDAAVNITDPVHVLNFLFLGGPAPECGAGSPSCADVNADAAVNITDAVCLLNWLFLSGPEPACGGGPQVIAGFTFTRINEQGYPEYTHDATGIIFVCLPGGKFNMGSPENEPYHQDDEDPVHEVTLSLFLIAKYELTQGQWKAIMGSNPSWFQGANVPAGVNSDNLPVDSVSWDAIQGFEAKTGLGLPTEAQWEYAARAGTQTAFPFGSGETCSDSLCGTCDERDGFMWYCGNSGDRTHEVGTKAANAFGLHDVLGNVFEWCEDVHDSEFYSKPEAAGPDPLSTSGSEHRVSRGGIWFYNARDLRTANRGCEVPSRRDNFLGFRPAVWPLSLFVAMLPGDVPLEMVWCPPGTFLMGAYPGEQDIDGDEVPQHQVTLTRGFHLGKYEVTKRQWEAVMGTRPWVGQPEVLDDPDSPAVYVSWDDAQAFIGAVNLLGQGTFRLPTEAEREYACRAGTTTRFHWGDDPACAQVGDYEWYLGNAGNVGQSYAHVVGLKLPNPWGLYDMNGNVEEWCQDWFSQEYPSEAVTDPVGPPSGVLRVLRCAGWFSDPRWCRSDDRGHNDPSFRHPGQGFRVARQ